MSKTKINLFIFLAAIVLLIIYFTMGNTSYFTASKVFNEPSSMMVTDSDGNITLIPVKNIDSAINGTVGSLKSELNPTINSKLDTTTASDTYLTKTNANTTYASKDEAVKYNDKFRLTTEAQVLSGTYARHYKDRMGWNPWRSLENDNQARWIIEAIP